MYPCFKTDSDDKWRDRLLVNDTNKSLTIGTSDVKKEFNFNLIKIKKMLFPFQTKYRYYYRDEDATDTCLVVMVETSSNSDFCSF